MRPQTATATLRRYLVFPFQSGDSTRRFIVGSTLVFVSYFIPLVPLLFVNGYSLRVMHASLRGEPLRLPAWTDWGRLGLDGLRLLVIGLVYALPGVIVTLGAWGFYAALVLLAPTFATALSAENSAAGLLVALLSYSGGLLVAVLATLLGLTLIMAGTAVLPAATAHFVATDQLAAAFRVREWWPLLRKNKMGYLSAWLIALGLAVVVTIALNLSYYALVLCCLVPIIGSPLSFHTMLISAALFGETYGDSIAHATAASTAVPG